MKFVHLIVSLLPYVWLVNAFIIKKNQPRAEVVLSLGLACLLYHVLFLFEARKGFTVLLVTYYFFWIFMGIAPLACSLTGLWLWGDITNEYPLEIVLGTAYSFVFVAVFVVAFQTSRQKTPWKWASKEMCARKGVLLLAGLIAALVWPYIVLRLGIEGLLSRAGGESLFQQSSVEVLIIFNFLRPLGLFVCVLPLISLVCFKDENVRPKWLAIAIALVGIGLNLPFSVPRYYALMTIGVLIYFASRQSRWRFTPYAGAILLVLGFFGSFLVNTFRDATSGSEVAARFSDVQLVKTEHFYYGDLDAYEMLTYGISYVNENGISWGRELLGAALFWVPRSIWQDKPVSTGHMLGEGYINIMSATANVNLSAPIVLEGMINFGISGVVGIAFACGWFSGGLTSASARRHLVLGDAILAPLTGLWLFMLRGSLMSALAYTTGIALAAVTAMLILFYSRKTKFRGSHVA